MCHRIFDLCRKAPDLWFTKVMHLAVGKVLNRYERYCFGLPMMKILLNVVCILICVNTIILNHFNSNLVPTQRIQVALGLC